MVVDIDINFITAGHDRFSLNLGTSSKIQESDFILKSSVNGC
jgi:hypothetical protein